MTKKIRKEVQVVLTQAHQELGKTGSLVVVRSGYARNYLIPQKIAELATSAAIKLLEVKQKETKLKEKADLELYQQTKSILENMGRFIIQKRVGDNNKIFGKITLTQVKDILESKGNINLKNATIKMPEIKELGLFPVEINFNTAIKALVNVEILAQ